MFVCDKERRKCLAWKTDGGIVTKVALIKRLNILYGDRWWASAALRIIIILF